MTASIATNWPVMLLVTAGLLAIVWLLLRRRSRGRERHHAPDALDHGVTPAQRNQALIDAQSSAMRHSANQLAAARAAAPLAGTGPDIFGGIGAVFAAAAASEVVAAQEPGNDGDFADDLTRIKGVGPKLASILSGLGVSQFSQIAAWTEADLAALDARLGSFSGRPARDHWVEQAEYLARHDSAGYEAKFGKL